MGNRILLIWDGIGYNNKRVILPVPCLLATPFVLIAFSSMIKWHYKLWREAEKRNMLASLWYTGLNLVCGMYKKVRYVKN